MTQEIVLDLPAPPSVNRFTGKLGNRSPKVQEWIATVDALMMQWRRPPSISGPFSIDIEFSRTRGDLDNRIKPLLDYLQRVELIENDKLCERITAYWGVAPLGCRVVIRKEKHGLKPR